MVIETWLIEWGSWIGVHWIQCRLLLLHYNAEQNESVFTFQ